MFRDTATEFVNAESDKFIETNLVNFFETARDAEATIMSIFFNFFEVENLTSDILMMFRTMFDCEF